MTLTGTQLIERGIKPKTGQSVLLTGALGGVGRTAAYVAGQHNAQVIAAVRPNNWRRPNRLGLGRWFRSRTRKDWQNSCIDSFADTIGGPVAAKLLKLLRPGAIYATVVGAPPEAATYDIPRGDGRGAGGAVRLARLAEAIVKGQFKIPVARVMKLAEAGEAQRLGQAGGAGGKIVLCQKPLSSLERRSRGQPCSVRRGRDSIGAR